jgi:predicted methyltransferase/DNA-directed RNA polymerase subunit RPC12/RpoP
VPPFVGAARGLQIPPNRARRLTAWNLFQHRRCDGEPAPAPNPRDKLASGLPSSTLIVNEAAKDLRRLVAIAEDVAKAVDLREGSGGVLDIIRQIARHGPVAVKELSQLTGVPVPVVAATCNELRARNVLSETRPVMLGPLGHELTSSLAYLRDVEATCPRCEGRELIVPSGLEPLLARLTPLVEAVPDADLALDQTHCTIETKLLRALYLTEAGRLTAGPMLFLGDDDLISVAVALTAEHFGVLPFLPPLVVVDVDERLVAYLKTTLGELGVDAAVRLYDVREPLPEDLVRGFATVVTDPPYTVVGVDLFVSRAVAALEEHGQILLSLGPKSPHDTLAIERALNEMGLFTRALIRNFNTYVGAGILGGVSHLYHLGGAVLAPHIVGRFEGEFLYTAKSGRVRLYRCANCGNQIPVGAGETYTMIAELKRAGCPHCGEYRFRPQSLAHAGP